MPAVKEAFVQEIIERYDGDPGMLIPMMQDLQAEYGYLPPEELKRLSKELGVPLTRVYGVAMFYSSFRLVPKGRHEVTLCMGTVCHLKGAPRISEAICAEYAIQPGGTTVDRLFTLQAVNCVGACALAPVMIVDGKYYAGVNADSALKVLRELASQAEGAEAGPPPAAAAPQAPEPEQAPPAAPAQEQPGPVLEKQAPPKAARTPAKSRAKPKAAPKAASGAKAASRAKASPAKAAKPPAAVKKEKPARAVKKGKPGDTAKRAARGTKKGGRR
jgi:NADH-quinone oxidoreductase subunit E